MFYNNNRYIPSWRLWLVHIVAKSVGVLVHVHGMPYGTNKEKYGFPVESGI